MNQDNGTGWVAIPRALVDDDIMQDALLLQVYVFLQCSKNYKARRVATATGVGMTHVYVQAGQTIVGRRSTASKLGMSESAFRRRLNKLKSLGYIEVKTTRHFSVVTVLATVPCVDGGESGDPPSDPPSDPPTGPASTHQPTTPKTLRRKDGKNSSRRTLHFDAGDRELAEHLWRSIRALQPDRKPPDLEAWADEIRIARERDGRTLDELRKVFDAANADTFWQRNILSPGTLRKRFDDLKLKLLSPNHGFKNGLRPDASPARPRSGEYSNPDAFRNTPLTSGA